MSDGTSTLRFLELTRFQERRRLKVMDAGVPIERLNELEMDPRRDLGERLGDRLHRPHFSEGWARARLDQSQRAARERRRRS